MKFLDDLQAALRSKFPAFTAENALALEACPPGQDGDFTINCFRIAKFCGGPNGAVAAVTEFLNSHEDIAKVTAVKAFVNITLTPAALFAAGAADVDALLSRVTLPENLRRRVLIEFSAPNTNKPQHLGHVRNNTLGMTLGSLLKRIGHDVVEINLVNDRGIHICKSMLAYERFGEGVTPESCGKKGDHLVGDFYVKFNTELSKEIDEVRKAHPEWADKDKDELFLETELGQAAQEMLRKWEAGDAEVRQLWEKMNSWVFKGFAETYTRMGINFDHTYLESQTYLLGKDVVQQGLDTGVFTKREDGAVICDLGKMGTKVVLRSDGTSVYITQDLGTTLRKFNDYTPEELIWVVGDEQNLHFKMLFEMLNRLGYDWAQRCFHLSYGMVNLPSGKMKSREGTVVDADDLFDEMSNLAAAACAERNPELSQEELKRRGEIIGLGALKFMLLKFNPKTTMIFDPQASLRFEGDTGPYVQYVCARVGSIERKLAERGLAGGTANWSLHDHPAERDLAVKLFYYPSVLHTAGEKRDCSGVVDYLLDLAKSFNAFYRECPVLTAAPELIPGRVKLAQAVRQVLSDGLNTLTIQVPEVM